MNTKQILYNALQMQLEAKKQAYDVHFETITQTATHELITEVREYITPIASIDDSNELEFNSDLLRIRLENGYSGHIDLRLRDSWNGENRVKQICLEWNSGQYNLHTDTKGLRYISVLNVLAQNIKSIEDIWINDWRVKYNNIWEANNKVKKEHDDLQSALNTLRYEIQNDLVESMKQVGFELKQFKPDYSLDWDFDTDMGRKYKINVREHRIKLQHGRSQYDTCYVNGFKVLSKKGNKYNIEINKDGRVNTCSVLEKKFDSFVYDVIQWENDQADKRKADTEKNFAERSK